jgi:hypothetical protein
MSASTLDQKNPFRTAAEIHAERETQRGLSLLENHDGAQLVVRPELELDKARDLWNQFDSFRNSILAHPSCADDIGGTREMNRTGATRLALVFGLSIEERDVAGERVQLDDSGNFDYRFIVRLRVGKGGRWVDGIGSCRISEIEEKTKRGDIVPLSQREHFALTKAWTRASKRAIADLLGGTEAD